MSAEQEVVQVRTPLTAAAVRKLRAGMSVRITWTLLTARDAAHKRLVEAAEQGEPLPVDLRGQVIYYTGPTPAPPGALIGSAGPTTAARMDPFTPQMLEMGVRGMIGKGDRSPEVIEAIKQHRAVYFAALGGAGALLSLYVVGSQVVGYPELGTEAIRRLEVEDFPALVAIDWRGRNLFVQGVQEWRERLAGER